MTEPTALKLGENTAEGVALQLLNRIGVFEELDTAQKVLDMYAECLYAVRNPQLRIRDKKESR